MNFREDPTKFTNYNRSDAELQLTWLFCLCVAGKTALVIAKALETFFLMEDEGTPFERVQKMIAKGTLVNNLKEARIGQYNKLAVGFEQSLVLDLRNATRDDLRAIKGVGYKTASYFIMHTRPNQQIATLDRHVLNHLGTLGYSVPKATPNDKQYLELEKYFLKEAQNANMTPADFDLMLWNKYSRKVKV